MLETRQTSTVGVSAVLCFSPVPRLWFMFFFQVMTFSLQHHPISPSLRSPSCPPSLPCDRNIDLEQTPWDSGVSRGASKTCRTGGGLQLGQLGPLDEKSRRSWAVYLQLDRPSCHRSRTVEILWKLQWDVHVQISMVTTHLQMWKHDTQKDARQMSHTDSVDFEQRFWSVTHF